MRLGDLRISAIDAIRAPVTVLAGVALLDFLTGYEMGFSFFYLIPIALVAWRNGHRAGLCVAAVAAAAWRS